MKCQALKKADIITLSIGTEELFSKLRSTYSLKELECKNIDSLYENITLLLKEIRKIVGPYLPIAVVCDPLGNLTKEYVESTQIIRSYRNSPHTDKNET